MFKVMLCSIATIVLLVGGAAIGDEKPKPVSSDIRSSAADNGRVVEQLQGMWTVVGGGSCDKGASAFVEESNLGKMIFNFKDTTYTVFRSDGKEVTLPDPDELQQFSIDASKTPIWIDYEGAAGILRLERDTLTICFGSSKERPTKFDLVEGEPADTWMERVVLHRFKPKVEEQGTDATPPVALTKGLEELQGTWKCVGILEGQSFREEFAAEVPDIKIKGDIAITLRNSGEKRTKCKIEIHETRQPTRMDISNCRLFSKTYGLEFSPKPTKAIFRIEGDELTICTMYSDYPVDFRLTSIQTPYVYKKRQ